MTACLGCRRCIAAGLVWSALVHGAAAAWLLRLQAPAPLPAGTRAVELDLAMFAGAVPRGEADGLAGSPPEGAPSPAIAPMEPAPAPLSPQGPDPRPEPLPAADPEPRIPPEPPPAPTRELAEAPEQVPAPAHRPAPRARADRRDLKPRPNKPKAERPAKTEAAKPAPPRRTEQRAEPVPKPRIDPVPRTQPPALTGRLAPEARKGRTPAESDEKKRAPVGPGSTASGGGAGTGKASPGPKAKASAQASRPAAAGPASSASAERAYLGELQRAIARHQRFPEEARARRQTGTATIAFVVLADGRIRDVRISRTSGDASLDKAALQALHRLDRFKPIPAALGRSTWPMRVPIRFDLR